MSPDMNSMMRARGNRSRALPNIGQTPAVAAANAVMGAQATQATQQAPPQQSPNQPNPFAAPNMQPMTMTMHPPGTPADPNHYNYEPEPDGAWRVYPPGVPAPPHMAQASLPRAASTADYRRMREAFAQPGQVPQAPAPASGPAAIPSPMI